jgi:hypothetical protein
MQIDMKYRPIIFVGAVSMTPALKDWHAMASVVLLKDEETKNVEQSLE